MPQPPPLLPANALFLNATSPLFLLSLSPLPSSSSMELNFCYHRSLKLTSPLSLSTHRTHFLGCVHTLRPPSTVSPQLRNRNKRSRLGLLPLRSSRFVFKASFQSHPLIVVVVVVTLSAVSLLHFTRNKKKKTLNQVNSLDYTLS